eukprot:8255762-Pyramimonas_sp.AAC.1
MDPPTPVGRYLGCEHRVSEKWVAWQGVAPIMLDSPPPKEQKTKGLADSEYQPAAVAHGATQRDSATPIYCGRSFRAPKGHSAWVRYDANTK